MKLKSHIPIEIDIGESEKLKLGAKRLTFGEANALKAQYRAAQNAKGEASEEAWSELIRECFKKYVRLENEVVIELADGEEKLRKAEDLLDFFGGDFTMLVSVVLSVISQSAIDVEKKMRSPRPTVLPPSSGGQERALPGPSPETTATSAENGDSAETGGASSPAEIPSGSTDPETTPSSSTSAPSFP